MNNEGMMNRNCIFHIPWKLDDNLNVASDIRPMKICNALKAIGYNVEIIWGSAKERRKHIKRIRLLIKNGVKFDFMYSESSTLPTLLTEPHHLPTSPFLDFSFFRFCKKYKIPIGLFYRDIYWNVKEVNRFGRFKQLYSKFFHLYDILKYNSSIDVLFLPHEKMRQYISLLKNAVRHTHLYPGADNVLVETVFNKNILYVGGVNPQLYDVSVMIEAFKDTDASLILCCREREWKVHKNYYEHLLSENVQIRHLNTNEIKNIYHTISYTIMFFPPKEYRKLATPFKLFEYIGNEKPIISSNNSAASDYIKTNDIGFVLECKTLTLRNFLLDLPTKNIYQKKIINIKKTKQENLWEKRAEKIAQELSDCDYNEEK